MITWDKAVQDYEQKKSGNGQSHSGRTTWDQAVEDRKKYSTKDKYKAAGTMRIQEREKKQNQIAFRNTYDGMSVSDWMKRYNNVVNTISQMEKKRNGGYTSDASYGMGADIESLLSEYAKIRVVAKESGIENFIQYRDVLRDLQRNISELNTYFGQFGSEDEWNWYNQYQGQSFEDLQNAYDRLEEGAEKDWLRRMRYDFIKENHDFADVSASGLARYQSDTASGASGKKPNTFLRALSGAGNPGMNALSDASFRLATDKRYQQVREDWTDDQRKIFGYLYEKNPEQAAAYATEVNNTYNAGYRADKEKEAEAFARKHPIASTIGNIAEGAIGMGIADFEATALEKIARGEITEKSYLTPHQYSERATGTIANDLNEKHGTINEKVPVLGGRGLGDAYQLANSFLTSMLAANTIGKSGAELGLGKFAPSPTDITFFGNAAASAIYEAKERGATDDQAILKGVTAGAAEAMGEHFSVSHLLRIDNPDVIKPFLKDILSQAFVEGEEEVFTSLVNNLADYWIMGDKSQFLSLTKAYLKENPNAQEKDAVKYALLQMADDMAFDFLGGFASGGASGFSENATNRYVSNHYYHDVYGNSQRDLVQEAQEIGNNSKEVQKAASQLDNGKSLSGSQLGAIAESNDRIIMEQAVSQRLTEMGETGDVESISRAITKQARNEALTSADRKALKKSSVGDIVAREIRSGEIWGMDSETTGDGDRYNEGTAETGNPSTVSEQAPQPAWEATKETPAKKPGVLKNETLYDVSGYEGKTMLNREDGSTVETNITGVASNRGGELMLYVSDSAEPVSARQIDFANDGEAMLYYTISNMELTPVAADRFATLVRSTGDTTGEVATGLQMMYTLGENGVPLNKAMYSEYAINLSPEMRRLGYTMGRDVYNAQVQMAEERKAGLAASQRANAVFSGVNVNGVQYDGLQAKTGSDGSVKIEGVTLNDQQKTGIQSAELLGKMGYNIHVFHSQIGGDGKPIGENGSYRSKDGSIHIDLNAGSDGQGVMAYTIAHEVTHHAKEHSPRSYQRFCDALFEALDIDVEAAIKDMANKLKERHPETYGKASKKSLTEAARDEVVAQCCETMLTDTDAAQRFAQRIQQEDKNLWDSIVQWFKDFAQKLREAYSGLEPDSPIAQNAKETIQKVDGLVQMWVDMVVDGGAVYRGAGSLDAKSWAMGSHASTDYASSESTAEITKEASAEENGKNQIPNTAVSLSLDFVESAPDFSTFDRDDSGDFKLLDDGTVTVDPAKLANGATTMKELSDKGIFAIFDPVVNGTVIDTRKALPDGEYEIVSVMENVRVDDSNFFFSIKKKGKLELREASKADISEAVAEDISEVQVSQADRGSEAVQFSDREESNAVSLVNQLKNNNSEIRKAGIVAEITGDEIRKDIRPTDAAMEYVKSFGGVVTRPGFGDVRFSKTKLKSGLVGHGFGNVKIDMFAAVPDVIRNGVEIGSAKNWKGRGKDSFVFAAPIKYKGNVALLGVIVERDPASNMYYVHEAVDENGNVFAFEAKKEEPTSDRLLAKEGSLDTVVDSSKNRLPHDGDSVKYSDRTETNLKNQNERLRADVENLRELLKLQGTVTKNQAAAYKQELKKVREEMERETKKELDTVTKNYRKQRAASVENRKNTQIRQKIFGLSDQFKKMATAPAKANTSHVPVGLMYSAIKFCDIFADAEARSIEYAQRRLDTKETFLHGVDWESELSFRAKKDSESVAKRQQQLEKDSESIARQRERLLKKQQAISEMQKRYAAMKENSINAIFYNEHVENLLNDLQKQLSDKDIYMMSSSELTDVYNTMKAMMHTITNANKLFSMGKDKQLIDVVKKLAGEIDGAQVSNGAIATAVREYKMYQMTPDTIFNFFCGFRKDNEGKAIQKMFVEGEKRMLGVQRYFYEMFRGITESQDKGMKKHVEKMLKHPTKEMIDWGLKDAEGNSVKTTRDMMLQAYMMLCQQDSFESLVFGGFKLPNTKQYYRGKIEKAYGNAAETALVSQNIQVEYGDMLHRMKQLRELIDSGMLDADSVKQYEAEMDQIRADAENLVQGAMARTIALRDNIEMLLTDYDRKCIETARNWYRYTGQLMSEVYQNMYGYEPVLVADYVPIHRDLGSVKIDIREGDERKAFNLENSGFTKDRVKSKAPILLTGFFNELAGQKQKISKYYGFAQVQKDFNRIWNMKVPGSATTVKNKIAAKYGKGIGMFGISGEEYINHYIQSVAGVKSNQDILSAFYGNAAAATLSLNPRVAISQVASVPTAAAVVGWKSMAKGFAKGLGTSLSTSKKVQLANESVWFWQRYRGAGGITEIADLKSSGGLWAKASSSKVGKKLFNWCQTMDVFATASMWAMAEDYVQSGGMKATDEGYKAAVEQCYEDIIRKSQPNYTATERSEFLRDRRAGTKLLTMYKTQSNQNFNILVNAIGEYRAASLANSRKSTEQTKADKKAAEKNLANAVTSVIIGGTFFFVAARTAVNFAWARVGSYKDDETDEITKESFWGAILRETLSSISGMFVLGSDLYGMLESLFTGDKYYGISDSAISLIADVPDKFIKLVQKAQDDEKTVEWKDIEGVLSATLSACGVPYKNAAQFRKAAQQWYADFQNGTLGQYTGDTSKKQYRARILKYWREGDMDKVNSSIAALAAMSDEDSDEDVQKDVTHGFANDYLKKRFEKGEVSAEECREILKEIGHDDPDGVADKWAFQMEYPDSDLSDSGIRAWKEHSDIPIEVFEDVWSYNSSAKSDIGTDGKPINGSKKDKVVAYIHKQNLTRSQKDALYIACGLSESTINKTPWH